MLYLNLEGLENVNISDEFGEREIYDIKILFCKYFDVFIDVLGLIILVKYEIRLISEKFVCIKLYLLFFILCEIVCEEVRRMLEIGIIELLISFYILLIVIVKKKDGFNRFCIDFRVINRIIVFDVEMILCVDDIFV